MATTRQEIKRWLEEGKSMGATHMIVACDTYDWSDYPVFVMPGEDVRKKAEEYENGKNMRKLMEVYSFNYDIDKQLREDRAFHYD